MIDLIIGFSTFAIIMLRFTFMGHELSLHGTWNAMTLIMIGFIVGLSIVILPPLFSMGVAIGAAAMLVYDAYVYRMNWTWTSLNEDLAHVWVGLIITAIIIMPEHRFTAIAALVIATGFEVAAFIKMKRRHDGNEEA